jgi:hypothetical protein
MAVFHFDIICLSCSRFKNELKQSWKLGGGSNEIWGHESLARHWCLYIPLTLLVSSIVIEYCVSFKLRNEPEGITLWPLSDALNDIGCRRSIARHFGLLLNLSLMFDMCLASSVGFNKFNAFKGDRKQFCLLCGITDHTRLDHVIDKR